MNIKLTVNPPTIQSNLSRPSVVASLGVRGEKGDGINPVEAVTSENINAFKCVKIDPLTGTADKISSDDFNNPNGFLGVTLNAVLAGQIAQIATTGMTVKSSSFNFNNAHVFRGRDGEILTTPPTGGDLIQRIGVVIDSTSFIIDIGQVLKP